MKTAIVFSGHTPKYGKMTKKCLISHRANYNHSKLMPCLSCHGQDKSMNNKSPTTKRRQGKWSVPFGPKLKS